MSLKSTHVKCYVTLPNRLELNSVFILSTELRKILVKNHSKYMKWYFYNTTEFLSSK